MIMMCIYRSMSVIIMIMCYSKDGNICNSSNSNNIII